MTLSEFCSQQERLPREQIAQNLNDIQLLSNEFKGSKFEGTEIIPLERVVVVCKNPSTRKLELKIMIHALIRANIGDLIDKFDHFCADSLSGYSEECTLSTEINSEKDALSAEVKVSSIESLNENTHMLILNDLSPWASPSSNTRITNCRQLFPPEHSTL